MKAEGRRKLSEWFVTLPSFVWLLVLFLIPTVLVFAIMFKPATPYGGIGDGWTLATLRTLGNPNYPAIVWRTLWLSAPAFSSGLQLSAGEAAVQPVNADAATAETAINGSKRRRMTPSRRMRQLD